MANIAQTLDGVLSRTLSRLPGVRSVECAQVNYDRRIRITVTLAGNQRAVYEYNAEEFRGRIDIERYFEIIRSDIARRVEADAWEREIVHATYASAIAGAPRLMDPRYEVCTNAVPGYYSTAFDIRYHAASIHDSGPTKKSAELFKLAAGAKAYKILNKGGRIDITGSKGGKYSMEKAFSYCITRLKDKAKMCAVVPGVPLWDHLLGIKLMIEHDEPLFIKTANVAHTQEPRPQEVIHWSDAFNPFRW